MLQSTTMEFAQRVECEVGDLKFREESSVYLRTTDRQLQYELGEQTRWGDADTYDNTRKCRTKESAVKRGKKWTG